MTPQSDLSSFIYPFIYPLIYLYIHLFIYINHSIPAANAPPPHQHRHKRTRQPHLAKREKGPRGRVGEFELVGQNEVRDDHLHDDRDVETGGAVVGWVGSVLVSPFIFS